MKTLSDLKRNAKLYTWKLIYNSWYPVAPHQSHPRKVARIQGDKFSLQTLHNGKASESWLDWPKAKDLSIVPLVGASTMDTVGYEVSFVRPSDNTPDHIMRYILTPVEYSA
jgi:hypothetical protein